MKHTYTIFEAYKEKAESKLNAVQKKAEKLNIPFSYAIENERIEEFSIRENSVDKIKLKVFDFVVIGETVVIGGYKILAYTEAVNGENIIYLIDDTAVIPKEYYTRIYCDHCKSAKNYKYSYLLENVETKEIIQVGKTCMKLYIDFYNVDAVIGFYDNLKGLNIDEYNEDMIYSMGSGYRYFSIADTLNYTIQAVEKYGYIKECNSKNTANLVSDCLCPNTKEKIVAEFKIDASLKSRVDEIIKYYTDVEDKGNSYLHNLKVLFKTDYFSGKFFNFIVSAVPSYYKIEARIIKAKEDEKTAKVSNYIGAVGEKITVADMSLKSVHYFDNQWGGSYLYVMTDAVGNIYTWYASTDKNIDEDSIFTIKGTVKNHTDYREAKQTVLTRCKITLQDNQAKII